VGCNAEYAINAGTFEIDCVDCNPEDGGNCSDIEVCPCQFTNSYIVDSVYGNDDCTGGDCGDVNNPLLTIQEAINRANPGNTIYVNPGTYGAILVDQDVIIISLYTTDESAIYQTIISGGDTTSAVTFKDVTSDASLKGFTITGGIANYGAGIHLENSSPRLERLVIHGNNTPVIDGYGGGIYCDGSSPTIYNVTIADNFGTVGSGVYVDEYSTPTIINSIIWNNAGGDPQNQQQIGFPDEGYDISLI
ncbi:uncharacterized protein METZ01_LOCUS468890, partial [marine metagenome]